MKRIIPKKTAQAGFTLIELLVVMVMFIVVLLIASEAFNRIVTQASKLSKMEESNIEGIIGLEIMRHDLEQMGFGLPWGWAKVDTAATPKVLIDSEVEYKEALDVNGPALNDAPSGVPRAVALSSIATGNGVFGAFNSAYIAVKGTTLGSTKASQRWTNVPYHNYSAVPSESRPVVTTGSPVAGDKVIMISANFNDANLDHRLIVDPSSKTIFHQNYSLSSMSDDYLPLSELYTYMVYGVDSNTTPWMPFNRADFYIDVPVDGSLPPFCAPLTGVLYKSTVNHSNGRYRPMPLLDCIADMQVILGWDSSDDGAVGQVDVYSSAPKADGSIDISVPDTGGIKTRITGYFSDAEAIRKHLKMIKVYILAQEGKFDKNYVTPVTTIEVGHALSDGIYPKRDYTLSSEQQKYRWKLYRIVARPKNLSSNQH